MKNKELSIKQKNADKDLNIIIFATLIPLIIYLFFGNSIMSFAKSSDMNIWLKFIPIILIQFGLAGLGSLIVILYRKEKLKEYGLVKKNFFKTIILSLVVCIPSFIFLLINNEITSYLPLKGCFFTKLFLASPFPNNIVGYILIAIVWGFIEGFNYIVISEKINERYISNNKWLNYGAIVCGIICVLIHGMIGFDLYTLFEAITTFILIYGMLIIKEHTNNAWGCVLIFLLFWNAI
jgi:hypothetical protein